MYDPKEIFLKNLYGSKHDIPLKIFLDSYINDLRELNTEYSIAHAARLELYNEDAAARCDFHNYFDMLYTNIDHNFPGLNFGISGRKKSLIHTDSKIIKNLTENNPKSPKDIYGFRIILQNEQPDDLLRKCYPIMNFIIFINEQNNCLLQELSSCEIEKCTLSNIITPPQSYIHKLYIKGVKDYILYPKENGYQSLHATFFSPKLGYIEIQVRSYDMDKNAENGIAKHDTYKQEKYPDIISFEREKVHIFGYNYNTETNELIDSAGLETALTIAERRNF